MFFEPPVFSYRINRGMRYIFKFFSYLIGSTFYPVGMLHDYWLVTGARDKPVLYKDQETIGRYSCVKNCCDYDGHTYNKILMIFIDLVITCSLSECQGSPE